MGGKTNAGNFFEDFSLGQNIVHATPRTVTEGDVALYTALYGMRFAVQSSDAFAMDLGYEGAPVDDLLTFHMVFGKSVPDISLNAVANLGYAGGRFGVPVYPGDTLSSVSEVIGLKENSNGKTGVVYVRTTGRNQNSEVVLAYTRWVMVNKRDAGSPTPAPAVPALDDAVSAGELTAPDSLRNEGYDLALAGSHDVWDDYEPGERIDHVDGMTIEEADHMLATRLYQNTAKVHFNQHAATETRFQRRLVYGGHIISLARGLSFNGLANGFRVAAINGGRHVAPAFAGDTVYAWSEVIDKMDVASNPGLGGLRLRTVATKDHPCSDFPDRESESESGGKYHPAVILDFDYTVLMPRRA